MVHRIYHITHGKNLQGIITAGGLHSDVRAREEGACVVGVGLSKLKARRLSKPLPVHAGTCVGEYVPFYLCPRSVMLYVLHKGNHEEASYTDGQRPILHLSAPLDAVLDWAERTGTRWAASSSNASAAFAVFFAERSGFDELDWDKISASDFRQRRVRDAKQAELLVYRFIPFALFDQIGVLDERIASRTREILATGAHQPSVFVRPDWYF